jgi:tetratricopeptide (TPR) repeat protein
MKVTHVLFCLLLSAPFKVSAKFIAEKVDLHAKKYNMRSTYLKKQEENFKRTKSRTISKITKIQKIKLHIINGELNEAKLLLKEATLTLDFTKKIQYRYLSIIHFIEGNYKLVLKVLSEPEMNSFGSYTRTCVTKILSLIILDEVEKVKIQWPTCRDSLLSKSPTNLEWLQTIVTLKTSKNPEVIENIFKSLAIDNNFNDELRIYLKLALFLNMENKVIPRFKYFGFDQIKDFRTRELIGLNHFRNGDLVKAYQFLEDLETVNAEVFKGNIYLYQKKYDLAYAQYKLALKSKKNSTNTLERIIPLAWNLSQWDQGYDYTSSLSHTKEQYIQNMALKAAFLTMSDRNIEAKKVLRKISNITHSANPVEVSQIYALNALFHGDFYKSENYSTQSCYAGDALNCWLSMQLNIWKDFSKLVKRQEGIHTDVEDLVAKLTSSDINDPIKDNLYVDQRIIEELDNNLINLVPETTK